jgi:hypothetical protein
MARWDLRADGFKFAIGDGPRGGREVNRFRLPDDGRGVEESSVASVMY